MYFKTTLTAAAMLLAVSLPGAIPLVSGGQGNYTLKIASDASPSEKLAEKELAGYLNKISGASSGEKKEYSIVIGTPENTKNLPAEVRKKLAEAKSKDAFYIKTDGKQIYIIGKAPAGALYGTYTFLEKYLGVRWFYPGELGEEIPVNRNIIIGGINDFQTPDFKWRMLSVCGSSNNFVSTYDWMARNKMSINAYPWQLPRMNKTQQEEYRTARGARNEAGGHNIFQPIIPKTMFAAHPEYFALKKGKRVQEGRVNRCLAHPEVIARTADYLSKKIDRIPDLVIEFIGEDDSNAFCECEECKKLGTWNGKYSVSNLFHSFFKKVSDQVLAKHPDANIAFWAYWNYRDVPENPAIEYRSPNSYLMYALHQRCYAHDLSEQTTCNKRFVEEISDWKKRAARIGIYDYRHDAHCMYAPFEYVLANDFKTFKKMGVVAWADEVLTGEEADSSKNSLAKDYFRSNWQSHYLASKMLWDSSRNADEILNDAYEKYYSKAAPVMKKYHAFRRKLWDSAPGHSYLNGPERTAYCLNIPDAEKTLKTYLDEAEKLADSDKVKRRIAEDRRFLEQFWVRPAKKLQERLSQTKALVPQKTDAKIIIDGKFEEEAWLKAQPAGGFLSGETNGPAKEDTKVRVAYDKDNLYLAVNAYNKNAWSPVKADVTKKDGPVWEEDSIELQIAPPNESGEYYHLIINTKGTVYDASVIGRTANAKFDSGAEVKVRNQDQCFQYEIRIPLAPMKAKFGSEPWKMHFMRTTTNLQPPTSREWSSMDGVKPFQPELFRKVVFGKDYIANGNFSVMTSYKMDNGKTIQFPKEWYLAGRSMEHYRVEKTKTGNQVWVSGVLYTGFAVPKDQTGTYVFTVRAKGKGEISCRTWSWEGYSPRTNHRNVDLEKYPLTNEFKDYTFRCKYLPKEYWLIFYIGGTDVTVEMVSCILQP